jgi:hypothetical protein
MTAKPTMPSAPGDPDSTNLAMAAAPETPETSATSARRPYEAPRILFREPLEAMAAICSPHPPAKANKGLCPMGPISS